VKIRKDYLQWAISGLLLLTFVVALYGLRGISFEASGNLLGPGSNIMLPDVNWSANRRTLIMAIRPGCPWCTASAPFYRNLLRSRAVDVFHVVAISPESVQKTRIYLSALQLDLSDIRQVDFEIVGVQGTPTLVLVNRSGRIEATWVGKLSPRGEDEVFGKITGHRRASNVPLAPALQFEKVRFAATVVATTLADSWRDGDMAPLAPPVIAQERVNQLKVVP
jgi:hypothetical protein